MAVIGQLELADDEVLVAEIGDGSREAFAELYKRHFHELYDFAARIVRDRETAADIVQSAFARAWERAQLGAEISNARAWLFRVAHNAAIDEIRRRSKTEPTGGEPESGAFDFATLEDRGSVDPASLLIEKEIAELVWTTASSLNPQDYALLDLHVRRELEPEELAEELGVSSGALYTRMSRLRQTFGDALATTLLIRRGRADCEELNDLVARLEVPEGSREARRVVQAHVRDCETCQKSKQRYVTLAEILAGLAPVPLTPGLQEDIWRRISETLGLGATNGRPGPGRPEEKEPKRRDRGGRFAQVAVGAAVLRLLSLMKRPTALLGAAAVVIAAGITAGLVVALTPAGARPHDPTDVRSTNHEVGRPSTDRRIVMSWSRQADAVAYSVLWSHQPKQEPDAVGDLPGSAVGTASPALTPGRWYFHLRTENRRHAWTHTVHRGPYLIVVEPSPKPHAQETAGTGQLRPPKVTAEALSGSTAKGSGTPTGQIANGNSQPTHGSGQVQTGSSATATGGTGGQTAGGGAGGSSAGGGGAGAGASGAGGGPTRPSTTAGSPTSRAADTTPPAGQSVSLVGGPYYGTTEVSLLLEGGTDEGSGVDASSGIVERSTAMLMQGSCSAWSRWERVVLRGGVDTTVGGGRCYRYRYSVADRAGNRSTFSDASGSAMVDTSPPPAPQLHVDESAPNLAAVGTTLYYRPGSDVASFTVSADVADEESGIARVAFPELAGASGGAASESAPYTTTYEISAGFALTGPQNVTATNGAGLDASSDFVTVPDATGPIGPSVTASRDGDRVTLEINAGADSGSGVDPGSLAVEREDGCGSGLWTPVALVDGADPSAPSECVLYRISVSDNVGNVSTSSPAEVPPIEKPSDSTGGSGSGHHKGSGDGDLCSTTPGEGKQDPPPTDRHEGDDECQEDESDADGERHSGELSGAVAAEAGKGLHRDVPAPLAD